MTVTTAFAASVLPFAAHSVMAVVIAVPEPSTATLLAALAGASGAIHIGRSALRYLRARNR